MSRRRLVLPAVLLMVFLPCLVLSGACLTTRMWESVADVPRGLQGASLDEHGVLHLAVPYEDDRIWHVTASPTRGEAWTYPPARRVGPLVGALPPSVLYVAGKQGRDAPDGEIDVYYVASRDKSGGGSHTVWADGADLHCVIELPEPVDWGRVGPYLAVVVTPLTLTVDLVTAPVWVAWVVMTAGGHGDCWLPWCE